MAETKTKVTLVGTVLAKPGIEFVYEGESPGCETCKVKKACNNLNRGHRYRIVTVRSTHHECAVHLNGATAVEVMEAPVTMLISADMAMVNSKIKVEFSCNKSGLQELPSLPAGRSGRGRKICHCRCAGQCVRYLR